MPGLRNRLRRSIRHRKEVLLFGAMRRTFKRKYPLLRVETRAAARAGRFCIECSKPINANRSDVRYCGNECRQATYRKRRKARKAGFTARRLIRMQIRSR
jgi:predicted nucleic acid-binding Zn ribbon protein